MSDLSEKQNVSESMNEVITETPNETSSTSSTPSKSDNVSPQLELLNMVISDQNSALNCIIGYIGLAQRRGVFAIDESAKLYECIKMFQGDK